MPLSVSTHSRPKAAARQNPEQDGYLSFNTQPPEGGCKTLARLHIYEAVSTHSRPKAAAILNPHKTTQTIGFNTQPPEGGCFTVGRAPCHTRVFQHTAARRRLRCTIFAPSTNQQVSTHSRPKAAAASPAQRHRIAHVSTHSRPKAAAGTACQFDRRHGVSTHSRPKAAAGGLGDVIALKTVSTHSRPKAAAHRRATLHRGQPVSTHSRPKAAATLATIIARLGQRFNTQPPEGGCSPSRSPHPQRLSRLCFAKLRGKTVGRVWHSLGLLFPPR